MKRFWGELGVCLASVLPIGALLWWGRRKQMIVRLAAPSVCPKGDAVMGRLGDGFYLYGATKHGVHRYEVDEMELVPEAWESGDERVDVVLSGRCSVGKYSYKKATFAVRGTPEEYLTWEKRIEALKAA